MLPYLDSNYKGSKSSLSLPEDEESFTSPAVAKKRLRESRADTNLTVRRLLRKSHVVISDMGCTLEPEITLSEITTATSMLAAQKAGTNKLFALILGDIWNQVPAIYGNKTKLFKKAGIPPETLKQIRTFAMVSRVWPDHSDRARVGYTFLRVTSARCLTDKDRKRYLVDFLAKKITTPEIAAFVVQCNAERKAAGLDTDYGPDDADDEPTENEYNTPLLLAQEEKVYRQAARLARDMPEEYDMQRGLSRFLCREQKVPFDQAKFDSAYRCSIPYPCPPPIRKGVAKR